MNTKIRHTLGRSLALLVAVVAAFLATNLGSSAQAVQLYGASGSPGSFAAWRNSSSTLARNAASSPQRSATSSACSAAGRSTAATKTVMARSMKSGSTVGQPSRGTRTTKGNRRVTARRGLSSPAGLR